MARGWESKSVENQIDTAERESSAPDSGSSQSTTADARTASARKQWRERQRELLRLSRANVQRQLENCQQERYRDQLLRALADLDQKLLALDSALPQ